MEVKAWSSGPGALQGAASPAAIAASERGQSPADTWKEEQLPSRPLTSLSKGAPSGALLFVFPFKHSCSLRLWGWGGIYVIFLACLLHGSW